MGSEKCDILILGAGIVGLSAGIAALESRPDLRVIVVDKEQDLGFHASGRNSGVLHAGFYYSPDSLKAKFCRDGNVELKELCRQAGIQINYCGKVVVTQDDQEEIRLDTLFQRGVANGVELEIYDSQHLPRFEPLATTHRRFMWSPNTAISDSRSVIRALADKFIKRGGILRLGEKVELVSSDGEVRDVKGRFVFSQVVNCAGAQADRIASQIGIDHGYAMVPFMGIYRSVLQEKLPIRTLVYPVPHKINPFLGVHLTLTIDGKVKIGPTAIPVVGREQYSIRQGWSLSDIKETTRGTWALIHGHTHDFSEIVRQEWPKLFQTKLTSEASKLVPSAREVKSWDRRPPGIRAQLVHLATGRLEQDFVIQRFLNSTHVLNAVSPGWTSALPFGRYISSEIVLPSLN